MNIAKIQINNAATNINYIQKNKSVAVNKERPNTNSPVIQHAKPPADYRYNANIHFTALNDKTFPIRVDTINWEEYTKMKDFTKKRYRKLSRNFENVMIPEERDILLNIDPHPEFLSIPLQAERTMDEFIKTAQMYSEYKKHPIVCLGRSPKWFLNTSFYMIDGIPKYDFVAFSGRWFWVYDGDFGNNTGLQKMANSLPSEAQEKAYRKYLKDIQADPVSLIKKAEKAEQKVIITDYIDTGKGVTSFLDLMSRYADDQGVLDKFGKSFDLVTIGSNEYRQNRKNLEYVSSPSVWMPELLEPYNKATTPWGTGQIIQQKYYDLDYDVFKQMLLNQNTNECRSTYYPCTAWDKYQPNIFKIGKYKDISIYKRRIKDSITKHEAVSIFEPIVQAYRNLLNFTILDALNKRQLLRAKLPTKRIL